MLGSHVVHQRRNPVRVADPLDYRNTNGPMFRHGFLLLYFLRGTFMRRVGILLFVLIFATTGCVLRVSAQKRAVSPEALVADLYRQHDRKRSPFFQTRSRALVNNYFAKSLADLIWKDATTKKE